MAQGVPPAPVPLVGNVISVALSMVTISVLAICLTRRLQLIGSWKHLPLASWLILTIYIDSTLFVFFTAIISRGLGINDSPGICEGAILLCLICYMTTKVLIYFFLVEKAHIIRGSRIPRMKDKLYLFNFFGMIANYVVVIVLNFIFRIAYINNKGICIIGMQKIAMLPLITFDVVVNVYLTILFLVPLRRLYSYQNKTNTSLHVMALRTFIGSCATLTSSVANLTILMVLKGEPGWICLMCCNADILSSVLVLHWVTAIDSSRTPTGSAPAALHNRSQDRNSHVANKAREPDPWTNSPAEPKKVQAAITTERMSRPKPLGSGEDDVIELHKIRVQTEQTQEVEIDGRSDNSTVEYHAFPARNNSTEKMV
ncbi:hypothetical protein K469DRAFT_643676 [Zopfia rhizophila CBS 207.26]|uniref:Integral membrane protein n=1 Tax=Zopfia rhizophila CBS 207.26 TaxID=1314779 RepID=A0A6A6DJ30_9PEZI|nr:hypothetical protein K469DRAFT_643676 [Zopfia rhizophila CBS 207.26]